MLGYLYDAVGVKVKTYYGVVGFRFRRLLFYRQAAAFCVELGYAVSLRVVDPVSEDGGIAVFLDIPHGFFQYCREAGAVKDIIA